jgi:hypothetical protein
LEKVYYAGFETPFGTVWAAATEKGLVQVHASGTEEAFLSELRGRVEAGSTGSGDSSNRGARGSPCPSISPWT